MEDFPASGEHAWEIIKNLIDECDYYVLLAGERYGNLVPGETISFTEKEYEYAFLLGKVIIPIFARGKKVSLAESPEKTALQTLFRKKLAERHTPQHANSDVELISHFFSSFSALTNTRPQVGWMRGDAAHHNNYLEDYLDALKRNDELEREAENLRSAFASDADVDKYLNAPMHVFGSARFDGEPPQYHFVEIRPTLMEVFRRVGPALARPSVKTVVDQVLSQILLEHARSKMGTGVIQSHVYEDCLNSILYSFEAVGILASENADSEVGIIEDFWRLTHVGKRLLLRIGLSTLQYAAAQEHTA